MIIDDRFKLTQLQRIKYWLLDFRVKYLCRHKWGAWSSFLRLPSANAMETRRICSKCRGVDRFVTEYVELAGDPQKDPEYLDRLEFKPNPVFKKS